VTPRDCALLLAIPMSKAEFLADLRTGADKDLAKSLERRLSCAGKEIWQDVFSHLVRLIDEVAAKSAALGVEVLRQVRLSDLRPIIASHRVITLVAHWRFLGLEPADILDVGALKDQVEARASGAGEDQHPVESLLWAQAEIRNAESAQVLASAINRLLVSGQHHYQWVPGDAKKGPCPEAGLTRVLLEETFLGIIRPGKCIELADGLCSVWDFIARVPCGYDGTMDLTVCNSLILGEAAKRARPSTTFIVNRQPATAQTRVQLYKHVIGRLAETPMPYWEAVSMVHKALLHILENTES